MKPKPVYKLPEGDGFDAFLSVRYTCGDCKHMRDQEEYEWYKLGDTKPNARCLLLDTRVSTHIGSCSALSRPLVSLLKQLVHNIDQGLNDAYWFIVHRIVPRHRYHMAHTGLKPGYYDPCTRVLAVVFNEAARFVAHQEDEANKFRWNYSETPEHQAAYDAFVAAADYWPKYLAGGLDDAEEDVAKELAKKVLDNIGHMWY